MTHEEAVEQADKAWQAYRDACYYFGYTSADAEHARIAYIAAEQAEDAAS